MGTHATKVAENLCNKYGHKPLDSAKISTTDAIKTASKRAIQKTAEATGVLIGNKIADKITSVSKKSPNELQNEKIEVGRVDPKDYQKRYISPDERKQIIDELRLAQLYNNGISKIAKFLDSASNQPSKFRKKNWIEINYESKVVYTGSDIKFKTVMLRSNLCDYADAYILVKGTITITGAGDDDAVKRLDEKNKGVIFKNCAPFTKCISRINNIDIRNAQDIDIVMPMYNLTEYSYNCSKTSGSLWQYYKDDPNDNMTQSELFKSKIIITGKPLLMGTQKMLK